MTLPLSGSASINPLIAGWSWTGTVGAGTTIPYTFKASSESAVDPALRAGAVAAIKEFADVANVHFDYQIVSALNNVTQQVRVINNVQNTASVPLIFEVSGTLTGGLLGLSTFPFAGAGAPSESKITAVDVDVNLTDTTLTPGDEGFVTLLHELGHALGFSHVDTGESQNGTSLPAAEQTTDATVMNSTFPDFNTGDATAIVRPQSLMIDDIAALQYLYGANHAFHAGNDVYEFSGATMARTIWDGGGVDTLSSINYSGNVTLDLREGFRNVTEIGADRNAGVGTFLWMAFGSNIENARSGMGNDTLFGNALNNTMTAGRGNDSISASQGNDDVNGNIGSDTILGGQGADFLRGGQDVDVLKGNNGNDTLNGNVGNDIVTGGSDNDFINGNQDDDILVGDDGNDTLRGGQGSDQIFGGTGNDVLYGDKGGDRLNGGTGSDIFVVTPDSGADIIEDFEGAGIGVVDRIMVSPLLASSPDQIISSMVTILDNAVYIDFGAGTSLMLLGVTDIAPDDFFIG
jgi:serralysin